MKSKKKKRLLILIGILMVCLLPISLLSKVLVPWAEELGEVTTEAGAAPPGDDTVTDASNANVIDVGRTLLSGIQNGSIKYTDLSVEQAVQVVKALLADKQSFDWFCSLDDEQSTTYFGASKRRIQFEFELLMKDNTDMSFVKDMAVSDYDKFFGTTDGKSVISAVMNGQKVDNTAAADGGFDMNITSCAPGHEGVLQIFPLGKHFIKCIEGGNYISGTNRPPYGSTEVNGRTLYLMCGNDNLNFNSFFAFSTTAMNNTEWQISVAFPSASQMYFDYYWTVKGGAQPSAEVPDRDFHDALGKLMEGQGSTSSYKGKNYAYPGNWDDVITSARYKVFDADTGVQLNSHSILEMSVIDGQQITHKLRFETGTSYFGTKITVPQGTVFHYYQGNNQYDVVGGQSITVPNGTVGYFYAPLSTNGVMSAETVSAGWYVDTTYRFECTKKPVQASTGKQLNVQQLLCPITAQPSLNFSIKAEATSHVTLKKASSNPTCTNNNSLYDLAGTQYTVYNEDGVTVAKTVSGSNAVLTCNSAGNTNTLEMPIGKYVVKETKAGKGYQLNKSTIAIELTASNTVDNPYIINTTDKPVDDPISVALTKENNNKVPIKGAVYCIEYYPGIQTYSESEAQTKHTGSVSKWYFETDANGEAIFSSSPTASGYSSSPFFTSSIDKRTIPLGTVIMYEEKAPDNYTKSDKHWVFQIRQAGEGSGDAYLYGLDKNGIEQRYDGTTVSDTNAPKFSDTPIPVNLTVQKKNGNPTPQQGSTGDVTLEGAVFGLYVKRDIVDESTGETKVKAENYSVDTPLTHSDGTPVVDPTTGKQVIAKAGTATVNNESCNTQVNINKVGEEAVLNSNGEYEYVEKPLKGVLFGIYAKDAIKDYSGKEIAAADTCVGYAVTDSNGVASCDSKLVRGEYYYKELKTAGPQYVMDEDLHPFTLILANSKISTFNVNETLPIKNVLARGNIKVLKVNKDGRAPLAGAEFDVFNADGKIVDHLVTGADGTAMTKVLPYGKYSLRETKAPTGFVLSKATFDTEIIVNGDVPLLEITNSTITKLGSKGIFIVVGLAVIFAGLVTVICFKLRRK